MTLLPAAGTSWRICADGAEGKKEEDRKTAEQARACSAVFGEKTVLVTYDFCFFTSKRNTIFVNGMYITREKFCIVFFI